MARATLVVIATNTSFHFTEQPLQENDKWFHKTITASLFEAIEEVMVENGIAHNVVSVDKIRDLGACKDYLVTYNLPLEEK